MYVYISQSSVHNMYSLVYVLSLYSVVYIICTIYNLVYMICILYSHLYIIKHSPVYIICTTYNCVYIMGYRLVYTMYNIQSST